MLTQSQLRSARKYLRKRDFKVVSVEGHSLFGPTQERYYHVVYYEKEFRDSRKGELRSLRKNLQTQMVREEVLIYDPSSKKLLDEYDEKHKDDDQGDGREQSEENETVWEVEKILRKKTVRGESKYLVKWKSYGGQIYDDTWEPFEHIQHCDELLKEFYSRSKRKSQSSMKQKKKKNTSRFVCSSSDDESSDSSSESSSSSSSSDSSSSSSSSNIGNKAKSAHGKSVKVSDTDDERKGDESDDNVPLMEILEQRKKKKDEDRKDKSKDENDSSSEIDLDQSSEATVTESDSEDELILTTLNEKPLETSKPMCKNKTTLITHSSRLGSPSLSKKTNSSSSKALKRQQMKSKSMKINRELPGTIYLNDTKKEPIRKNDRMHRSKKQPGSKKASLKDQSVTVIKKTENDNRKGVKMAALKNPSSSSSLSSLSSSSSSVSNSDNWARLTHSQRLLLRKNQMDAKQGGNGGDVSKAEEMKKDRDPVKPIPCKRRRKLEIMRDALMNTRQSKPVRSTQPTTVSSSAAVLCDSMVDSQQSSIKEQKKMKNESTLDKFGPGRTVGPYFVPAHVPMDPPIDPRIYRRP